MDYTLYNIEKNHYLQCWYLSVQSIFCDFKFRCNDTVLVSLFYHHLSVYCPYLVKSWQKSLSFQELFPSICVKYILNISSVILKSYHCISCLEWWFYMTTVITPCIGKSIQCFFLKCTIHMEENLCNLEKIITIPRTDFERGEAT